MAGSNKNGRPVQSARRIVAIAGAKGGVGTSMITTNLGIFLAQIGKRVVIIDADVDTSGLHAWLGAARPEKTVSDLLGGGAARISEALSETSVTGLFLLAGAPDLLCSSPLGHARLDRFFQEIRTLEADFVLIDLPGGTNPVSVDLFSRSELAIAVTVGTPDSVEATYRLLSAVFLHKLMAAPDLDPTSAEILREMGTRAGPAPTPREITAAMVDIGSPLAEEAEQLSMTFHPQLVVNQTRMKADEELGEAMVSAAVRWLGITPHLLGSVGWDDNVWLALRRGLPLLIEFSRSRACKDIERIVRKILSQEFKDLFTPVEVPPPTAEQNLYQLLEIYPGASEEEVRRALKQIREWYGSDGLAGHGACTDLEREDYQRMAEEAHAKLLDKSKRREYDRGAFPDGFPSARERRPLERDSIAGTVAATHESLPKVELSDDQFVDGVFLGRIRKERNVELIDISNRAKISVSYLRAIEEEAFTDLPAAVFVHGFVTEYARYLKIDPNRAVRDFMAKFDAFSGKKRK